MALLLIATEPLEDGNGTPLAGGSVTFYDTNTTNLKTVYSDAALATPIANPMTLDAAGKPPTNVYAPDAERYTVLVKDSADDTIKTVNDVWGAVENAGVLFDALTGTRIRHISDKTVLVSDVDGVRLWGDGSDTLMQLYNSNGTVRLAYMQAFETGEVNVINDMNGGTFNLKAKDSGGIPRNLLSGNPAGESGLGYIGTITLKSAVRTTYGTGARVFDGVGDFQPVGLHNAPGIEAATSTSLTVAKTGFNLIAASGTLTFDINTTTDVAPNGCFWIITNVSGNNLTISATGVTLTFLNGAGGLTGARTIANGSRAVVEKRSDGQYWIVGNGIT